MIDSQTAPRPLSWLRIAGWGVFGLFLLVFFTFIKLPKDRIKNYVNGQISAVLAPQGISFSADRTSLSLIPLSYTLEEVNLGFPPPDEPVRIQRMSVSPSVLSLLLGKLSGSLSVEQGKGGLDAAFSSAKNDVSLDFSARKFDLGSIGLLPILIKAKASAILNGSGKAAGDFNMPSSLDGEADLTLSSIVLDQQSIAGFNIPRLSISEGKVSVLMDKAKLKINALTLGKPGSPDDIVAKVTGEINLGRTWESSMLDLKATFSLSPAILTAFPLIDALLGAAKRPDGSYAVGLSGPISMPNYAPLGARK